MIGDFLESFCVFSFFNFQPPKVGEPIVPHFYAKITNFTFVALAFPTEILLGWGHHQFMHELGTSPN